MTNDEALLQVAPELSAVPSERRAYFIESAQGIVNSRYGQFALANATAHMLTVASRGGDAPVAGPVTSEKEGELSRTYAQTSTGGSGGGLTTTPEYWATTNYGRAYWNIVRSNTFAALNRMM